jgi:hypothetical protein
VWTASRVVATHVRLIHSLFLLRVVRPDVWTSLSCGSSGIQADCILRLASRHPNSYETSYE